MGKAAADLGKPLKETDDIYIDELQQGSDGTCDIRQFSL